VKSTKSRQSEHHSHKEKGAETLEEETSLDQGTEDQRTVLEIEMIGHGSQEEDLEDGMTDLEENSEERDLALEKTDHVRVLEIETVMMRQEAEIVTTDQGTVLEIEMEIILGKINHVRVSETEIPDATDLDPEENQTALAENLEGIPASEKSLENEDSDFIWLRLEGQKRLATENYVEGNTVYGEKLYKKSKIEYRIWDPFRSKLAAALYIGLDVFPITHGTKVLYLGASTGTTVSHISDIVGHSGLVFAVEHASRVARDFLDRVANFRKNVMPILQDARHPKQYFSVYGKVDVVYSDIAQPDQTEIAIANCQAYLKDGGYLFLVIKTRSIDVTQAPKNVIQGEMKKLKGNFEIIQDMTLEPYDKDHGLVVAKYHAKG
jgi:fibrillarin-like pre-rRNA processing protein